MNEYIDRDALRQAVLESQHNNPHPRGMAHIEHDCEHAHFVAMIARFPAADVAPVVHGRWIFGKELTYSWGQIPKNKYHLYCSECLEQAFNRSEDNDPDFDVDTSYCHNCGAKMDGGDSDEAD